MMLPHDVTRCFGLVQHDQVCPQRKQCQRYLTLETDPKDRQYRQAHCLCYITEDESYYFYCIPIDDDE